MCTYTVHIRGDIGSVRAQFLVSIAQKIDLTRVTSIAMLDYIGSTRASTIIVNGLLVVINRCPVKGRLYIRYRCGTLLSRTCVKG